MGTLSKPHVLQQREYYLYHCGESSLCIPDVPEIKAYIAGLVDGEGTFTKRSGNGNWSIVIGMTNQEVIEWCAKFGGRVNIRSAQSINRKLPLYVWRIQRRADVLDMIEQIFPYLIVKRDRAAEAYTDIMTTGGKVSRTGELRGNGS